MSQILETIGVVYSLVYREY